MLTRLYQRLQALLEAHAGKTLYPPLVGLVALGCALGGIAFVPLLTVAVLLAPRHWLPITLFTSIGSAAGGTLLFLGFHHWGWQHITTLIPDLFSGELWQLTLGWLGDYGHWALMAIAATPLPQTPALAFLALTSHDALAIWLALAAGKLLKYGAVAYVSAMLPDRFNWLSILLLRLRHKRDSGAQDS